MTKNFAIVLIPLAVGVIFSLIFSFLKKMRLTKATRFALDFSFSALLCFSVYAPCFFWFDGIIMTRAIVSAAVGFALPRLFLRRSAPGID